MKSSNSIVQYTDIKIGVFWLLNGHWTSWRRQHRMQNKCLCKIIENHRYVRVVSPEKISIRRQTTAQHFKLDKNERPLDKTQPLYLMKHFTVEFVRLNIKVQVSKGKKKNKVRSLLLSVLEQMSAYKLLKWEKWVETCRLEILKLKAQCVTFQASNAIENTYVYSWMKLIAEAMHFTEIFALSLIFPI